MLIKVAYLTLFDECKCVQLKSLECKQLFSCITKFKSVLIDIIHLEVEENCKYAVLSNLLKGD